VTTSPAATLAGLHREGLLAAEYPAVRRLLAGLTGDELQRAGRLLARVDPDDVLEAHPEQATFTVAITGNGTISGLVPPLTAELARHGLLARPTVTDYGSWLFELSTEDSALHRANAQAVLCLLDGRLVADELPPKWTVTQAEQVLAAKVDLIERLATSHRGDSVLVLNTFPVPHELSAQLVDYTSRARLGAAWREANAKLLRLTENNHSVVVLDLEPLANTAPALGDPRLAVYVKQHLSAELLQGYAKEIGHLARHLTGRTKKTLVVDLDQTLWDGILAEDGVDGIGVGDTTRGEAFAAFQRTVAQLSSQGLVLAAVSKNDVDEVRRAFREHPGMILREDDFVQIIANWRPKHDNIRELAETLNLGVDSFVFADDSPYERGLVRHELPDVAVVDLDDEPASHVAALLADNWFGVRELTGEDRTRAAAYRQEADRKNFLSGFDSLQDYLRELDITVELTEPDTAQVPRVSQLTLRTNQFNLTTTRLQPQDVTALLDDPDAGVRIIRSSDRFGDNGIVGAVLTRRDGDALRIENFLLSCRVFSRGIEQTCLSAVLHHAREQGFREVRAYYRPTAKNRAVRDFYPRYGFTESAADEDEIAFRHDLTDIIAAPGHVRLDDRTGRPAS
jgi:FkbH-like protein